MNRNDKKKQTRAQRKKRIRIKIAGTAERPRMSVYRSLNHMYVQLIDDAAGRTLLGLSTRSKDLRAEFSGTGNREAAKRLGEITAQRAKAQNITKVVFDRNGFLYHGRVKALADGAREQGLEF